MLILTLRFLHIIFMATWIGAAFFVAGDVKSSLAAGESSHALLVTRLRRYSRVSIAAGVLTIVTGFALIFALGGFKSVGMPIHIGIVTALAMLGVGGAIIGKNSTAIIQGIESGKSSAEMVPHAKKIGMGVGIFHTLWMVTLVLMVFRAVI